MPFLLAFLWAHVHTCTLRSSEYHMYIYLYDHHHTIKTPNNSITSIPCTTKWKVNSLHSFFLIPGNHKIISTSLILLLQECYVNGITHYWTFWYWPFHQQYPLEIHPTCIHQYLLFFCFLVLHNSPWYWCILIYLTTYLLIGIWFFVISCFWLVLKNPAIKQLKNSFFNKYPKVQ